MPRAWQWPGAKQSTNKTLVNVIDKEEFSCSYIHTPTEITPLVLYEEQNHHISLFQRCNLDPLVVVMAALVASGLLPYKLETGDGRLCTAPRVS